METERKYLDPDFGAVVLALRKLGAVSQGQHFESNEVFDTPDRALFLSGRLLRLRVQEWPGHASSVLTWKYPCQPTPELEGVKAREELELGIADAAMMARILAGLGYELAARYEKVREGWQLEFEGHAFTIDLDILPFAKVVEIEGDPGGMDAVAKALGLDKSKISLKTYHELNQEWREKKGLERTADLLFDSGAREQLRADLGLNSAVRTG